MFKSYGLKRSALSEVLHELSDCYAFCGAEVRRRRNLLLSARITYIPDYAIIHASSAAHTTADQTLHPYAPKIMSRYSVLPECGGSP